MDIDCWKCGSSHSRNRECTEEELMERMEELESEITRLRALVEKRDSVLVRCLETGDFWITTGGDGQRYLESNADGEGEGYHCIPYDGTPTGLLAAVDEATEG